MTAVFTSPTALFSPEYHYEIDEIGGGLSIKLYQESSGKVFRFFQASYNTIDAMRSHMDSLTDELCEEWFRAAMTKEEQKAFRKAQKEERRLIEEEARRVELEQAELRRIAKAEEKARKRERFKKD